MTWVEQWVWPKVASRRNAQNAIDEGFWAAVFVSGITALLFVASTRKGEDGFSLQGALAPILFAVVAFGIRRRSRTAALGGLIVFVAEGTFATITVGPAGLVFSSLIALALLNAVRGTLAFHKLPPAPANMPTLEQSFRAVGNASSGTKEGNDAGPAGNS